MTTIVRVNAKLVIILIKITAPIGYCSSIKFFCTKNTLLANFKKKNKVRTNFLSVNNIFNFRDFILFN